MGDAEERKTLASFQSEVLKIYTSRVFPSIGDVVESDIEEEVAEMFYQHQQVRPVLVA